MILVATDDGLHELGGRALLSGEPVTAFGWAADGWYLIVDGSRVLHFKDGLWSELGRVTGTLRANCIAETAAGLLVGASAAKLLRVDGEDWSIVFPFGDVRGRDDWYTPWGGAPDVRSISESADGTLHVNVHVGGIPRSRDGGKTWEPTIDIDTDIHQVLAHPTDPGLVLAAGAVGLCVSRDGGDGYDVLTDGLHATYARAVAIAGDSAFLTVSRSHIGRRAAVYRAPIALDRPFEKCTNGLPEWFDDNIDTGCLSAAGSVVTFGTVEGSVYLSEDGGSTWEPAANGLPPVRAVAIGSGNGVS